MNPVRSYNRLASKRSNGVKAPLAYLLVAAILLSIYILDGFYQEDRHSFLSPLKLDTLRIRYDSHGSGHFGAGRKGNRTHKGVDILAPVGTPILAAKSGWGIAGFDKDGYGEYIKIYHRAGLITLYAHMDTTEIGWIEKVRQGDIIGYVGKTGNARYGEIAPHLHLEVRRDKIAVDPMEGYLR